MDAQHSEHFQGQHRMFSSVFYGFSFFSWFHSDAKFENKWQIYFYVNLH